MNLLNVGLLHAVGPRINPAQLSRPHPPALTLSTRSNRWTGDRLWGTRPGPGRTGGTGGRRRRRPAAREAELRPLPSHRLAWLLAVWFLPLIGPIAWFRRDLGEAEPDTARSAFQGPPRR
ncbi:PLD nuclease N-terminal domain-containing protein [Nocardia farcinica]|uniref:PLD nuclease N-terminal domain-containing protein n=1 Tax=Nocardia farcinica TaxID=37329 RepID=UPI0018958434|nr:PLDc_N domain-containing protein [Nocardia farcinica]